MAELATIVVRTVFDQESLDEAIAKIHSLAENASVTVNIYMTAEPEHGNA